MSETNTGSNTDLALRAIEMENNKGLVLPQNSQDEKKGSSKGGKFDEAVKVLKELSNPEKAGVGLVSAEETVTQNQKKSKSAPVTEDGDDTADKDERYNNLKSHADKVYSRAEKLARDIVNKDPEYIHELAKEDVKLANKIIASDLKEYGIKTYEELQKWLARKDMPETEKEILDRLEKAERKLSEREEAEQLSKIETFISQKGDIDEELGKAIIDILSRSEFSLEEAYEFARHKLGRGTTGNNENLQREFDQQNAASRLSTTGTRGSVGGEPKVSAKEIEVLKALGAKKTLAKLGVKDED